MDFFNYEPNLFLQGFVVVSGEEGGSEGTQTEGVKAMQTTYSLIHTQSKIYLEFSCGEIRVLCRSQSGKSSYLPFSMALPPSLHHPHQHQLQGGQ